MLLGTIDPNHNDDTIIERLKEFADLLVNEVWNYYNLDPLYALNVRHDVRMDFFYLTDRRPKEIRAAIVDPTLESVTNAIFLMKKTGVGYDVHINLIAVDPNQVAIRWGFFDKPREVQNSSDSLTTLKAGFDLEPIYGILINLPNEAPDLVVRGRHYDIDAYRQLTRQCPDRKMVMVVTSLTVSDQPIRIWFNNHAGDPALVQGEGECRLGKHPFMSLSVDNQEKLSQLREAYAKRPADLTLNEEMTLIDLSVGYLIVWVSHGANYDEALQNLFLSIGLPVPTNLYPYVQHMLSTSRLPFDHHLYGMLPEPLDEPPARQQRLEEQRQGINTNNRNDGRPISMRNNQRGGRGGGRGGRDNNRGRGGSHSRGQDRFG